MNVDSKIQKSLKTAVDKMLNYYDEYSQKVDEIKNGLNVADYDFEIEVNDLKDSDLVFDTLLILDYKEFYCSSKILEYLKLSKHYRPSIIFDGIPQEGYIFNTPIFIIPKEVSTEENLCIAKNHNNEWVKGKLTY